MKRMQTSDFRRTVGAAGRAISAALGTRHKVIVPDMLNSAGSVSAEWYIETLWHYLAKRALLQGVSGFDVEFKQPARLADKTLHFALPHPEADDLVMDFHVLRPPGRGKRPQKIPVARITIHRGQRRRRFGVAPEPPIHPYGIEVRGRHLNSTRHVSWYTLVSVTMDVARRGLQIADDDLEGTDPSLLYIVPRFTFTPLADAAAQDNLFIYPEFSVDKPWVSGKTSAVARVILWAIANEAPWPVAESLVVVVRTGLVEGSRCPVDELGQAKRGRDVKVG